MSNQTLNGVFLDSSNGEKCIRTLSGETEVIQALYYKGFKKNGKFLATVDSLTVLTGATSRLGIKVPEIGDKTLYVTKILFNTVMANGTSEGISGLTLSKVFDAQNATDGAVLAGSSVRTILPDGTELPNSSQVLGASFTGGSRFELAITTLLYVSTNQATTGSPSEAFVANFEFPLILKDNQTNYFQIDNSIVTEAGVNANVSLTFEGVIVDNSDI